MQNIPGWEGPTARQGTDDVCYHKKVGQISEQNINDLKEGIENIKERLSQQKTLFIKVKGTSISGGMVN